MRRAGGGLRLPLFGFGLAIVAAACFLSGLMTQALVSSVGKGSADAIFFLNLPVAPVMAILALGTSIVALRRTRPGVGGVIAIIGIALAGVLTLYWAWFLAIVVLGGGD